MPEAVGLTAPELAERVSRFHAAASPMNLRGWMLEQNLATEDAAGRLTPTVRGIELAQALIPNGRELRGSISPLLHR